MGNNKVIKKLKRFTCVLVAATFIGSYSVPAFAKNDDEVRENSYLYYSDEDAKEAYDYAKNNPEFEGEVTKSSSNEDLKGYKIGCYVSVNGRGNEASDGSGKMGYSWTDQQMMIVGIRENSEYPYACAIVDSDPSVEDVMAWFKKEDMKFWKLETTEVKKADKIVNVDKNGNEYITYCVPDGYELSGNNISKTTINYPVYSDVSEKTIANTYKISLK